MGRFVFVVLFIVIFTGFVFSESSLFLNHKASEIIISIDNYSMTLQEAYDKEFLIDYPFIPISNGTIDLKKSHFGNNIQIYLKDVGEISLQDAIDQKLSFCGETPGVFDWVFNFRHNADNIVFNDNETLQEKINTQGFCNFYDWIYDDWSECSVLCGEGIQTRTGVCKKGGFGDVLDDSYCSHVEFVDEQVCSVGVGTDCGFSSWSQTGTCSESACGTGTYERTRTCEITSEFCEGPVQDWNGASCSTWSYSWTKVWEKGFLRSGCSYLKIYCHRCDGKRVSDGHCSGKKPSNMCGKSTCYRSRNGACCTGSCSVLCTEAHKFGYISDEIYEADSEFGRSIDDATMICYHSWAKPLVRVMKTSPNIFSSAMPVIIEWGKQMAYILGKSDESSYIGEAIIDVGLPFCEEFGKILMREGYSIENEYEFDDEFIEDIYLKYIINKEVFTIDNFSEEKFKADLEDFFFELEKEFFSQRYL